MVLIDATQDFLMNKEPDEDTGKCERCGCAILLSPIWLDAAVCACADFAESFDVKPRCACCESDMTRYVQAYLDSKPAPYPLVYGRTRDRGGYGF